MVPMVRWRPPRACWFARVVLTVRSGRRKARVRARQVLASDDDAEGVLFDARHHFGTSRTTVVPDPGEENRRALPPTSCSLADDGLREAEAFGRHLVEGEADAGIRHHGTHRGLVVGDGDVGLGDLGVPAHVLEALAEGAEEGVEHVAGQQHLAVAVPVDLEPHAAEALLDRLERRSERRLGHGLERVDAGGARHRLPAEAQLPQQPGVVGGLEAQGVLADADPGVGEQREGREHGVVQQPGVLPALRLALAGLALAAVGAADARDAVHDPRHAEAEPPAEQRGARSSRPRTKIST